MASERSDSDPLEIDRLQKRIRELENQIRDTEFFTGATPDRLKTAPRAPQEHHPPIPSPSLGNDVLFSSLLHHMGDGVIVANAAGEMILFNASARRLIGIGPVAGTENWTAQYGCFYPDGITSFPSDELPLSRALRGETVRDEPIFVANDHVPEGVLVSVTALPLCDPAETVTGAIVIFHDMTPNQQQKAELEQRDDALVRAKREIETQRKLLKSIVENLDIGITVANAVGDFVIFNSAARRILGTGPVSGVENWTPKYGCYRMDGSPYPADQLPLARALEGEAVHGDELYIYNPETKKKVLLSVTAAPFSNPQGDLDGALCLFYDITGEKEAKAQFESVLENIEIAVSLVDSTGEFILFNAAARRLVGVGPVDGPDNWGPEYGIYRLDGDRYDASELPLARALQGEHIHNEVLTIYNPEKDEHRTLSVTATPFVNAASNFEGALCFAYDITATTEAQKQVSLSEDRFRAFMTNLPAVAFIKDSEGHYIYGNEAFYKYHQTTPEQVAEGTLTDYDLTSRESADQIRANDQRVISGTTPVHLSEILSNSSGESTWFEVYKFCITGVRQQTLVGGIAVDITDRRKAADRLKADDLLLRQMIELQEKERLLVAHDIHDGFVQDVVAAKMLFESFLVQHQGNAKSIDRDNTEFNKTANTITNSLSTAITEARRLISHLRPLIIDEEGIIEAIRYLISEKRYAESLKITFVPQLAQPRFDPLLEGNIYRILQEALNNVDRHSEAGSVAISLKSTADEIHLSITDDGCGFDPSQAAPDRFGLRGMRERARLFGGALTIDSRPERGTRIDVKLPLGRPTE
ncbi:MAG: PAS domain-containing protein [Pirellulales bacterium]|nr:PAS domain-containing protein [Pirellulales bacterium]